MTCGRQEHRRASVAAWDRYVTPARDVAHCLHGCFNLILPRMLALRSILDS
jgi:hypothetical protein